jgi:two-component system, chemotaxis family, protein-glutamate methylesterase/glutaminase
MEIKRRGGIAIAQRPDESLFPSMPQSAIDYVDIDRVLSVDDIGPAIAEFAAGGVSISNEDLEVDEMTARECDTPDVAEVGTAAMKNGELNGSPSRFTCPECHGALWELGAEGRLITYRCHVGHGYTAEGLMAAQSRALEEALWTGLRALEETAEMRRRMARRSRAGRFDEIARRYEEDAALAEERANIIRGVLVADNQPDDASSTPAARDNVARAGGSSVKGNGRRTNGRKSNGRKAAHAHRHTGEPVDPAALSDKPTKVTKGNQTRAAKR